LALAPLGGIFTESTSAKKWHEGHSILIALLRPLLICYG
jgi:hypothetical protein